MSEHLLDGLDADQQAVARATRGRVVVVAAAGSGKTRAISRRMAYAVATGAQRSDKGLGLSFTTRAAGELRGRLSQLGVVDLQTATFHSAALRQLSFFWPRVLGGPAWKILSSKNASIEQAARTAGIDLSVTQRRFVTAEIEWAKSSGLDPQSYAQLGRPSNDVDSASVASIWTAYQDVLTTSNHIDFEDVLSLTLGMLQQRPDVAEEVRRRYHWFTVDEFQDVTPLQQALLDVWLGDRNELCVVGDPAQTIYTFAGAAPNFLTQFQDRFPDSTVVELATTYRCAEPITQAANALLASEVPALRTGLTMTSATATPGEVTSNAYATDNDEAAAVAQRIRELLDSGIDLREIAILVRLNSMTVALERALDAAEIPYSLKGATRFFERREVKQVLLALRAESYSHSSTSLAETVRDAALRCGWTLTPTASSAEARASWESISALVALAADIQRAETSATVIDFFEEVARLTVAQHEPAPAAVTLSTIHAAKGLEWEYVFLPGVNEGTLPYALAQTEEAVAEERRLMYVAITRARRGLHVSWALSRNGQSQTASRFVDELGGSSSLAPSASSVSIAVQAPARVEMPLALCSLCGKGLNRAFEIALKRCQTCPAPDVSARMEVLLRWREAKAQAQASLPWLVLTEASLVAIAEQLPTTTSALGDIHGMTQEKLENFGAELLDTVSQLQ